MLSQDVLEHDVPSENENVKPSIKRVGTIYAIVGASHKRAMD
jgi:hypothetical protein